MVGRVNIKSKKNGQLRHCLTEENLRLHSYTFPQQQTTAPQWEETYSPYHNDLDTSSEDEDWDGRKVDIALRRAASLEALKIYGGCFTSGFLAMQDPLPWMTPSSNANHKQSSYHDVEGLDFRRLASELTRSSRDASTTETSSRDSDSFAGSPRPDSDTLSRADKGSGRRWNWKGFGKRRAAKHTCL